MCTHTQTVFTKIERNNERNIDFKQNYAISHQYT